MRRTTLIVVAPWLVLATWCCTHGAAPPPPPAATGAHDAPAAGPVRVGDVAGAPEAGPAALAALRDALGDAAARLGVDDRLRRHLVLDGAVTTLARQPAGAGVRVRVTVSLSVRDAAGGQILVVLDATTQATGPAPANAAERDAFEREVLEAAVAEVTGRLAPRLGDL